MSDKDKRIKRERKTVAAMIGIYCREKHNSPDNLCSDCRQLFDYAIARLSKCPFQEKKPTCAKCTIHCYREPEKTKMKEVMYFSGPKMLFRHPLLTAYHLFDGISGH